MKEIKAFKTSDGKIFESEELAKAHEKSIIFGHGFEDSLNNIETVLRNLNL